MINGDAFEFRSARFEDAFAVACVRRDCRFLAKVDFAADWQNGKFFGQHSLPALKQFSFLTYAAFNMSGCSK